MAPASFFSNRHSPVAPIGTSISSPAVQPSNGGYANGSSDSDVLWARINTVFQNDLEKRQLLEEIMTRYDFVSREYQRLATQQGNILYLQQTKQQLAAMHGALERNPYIMVLLDGDGMIFQDDFIREGLIGGKHAAARLYHEILGYVERETNNIPTTSRVVCRIYANVKGLSEVLVKAGITEHVSQFEEFARGFTTGRTLFDFIDVGPGKDRADDKIVESLKLFIDDFHCRQVFFGCSHDNGFARPLEEYMLDQTKVSKVTLLEGVPFGKELAILPYKTKKFSGLFRDSKINVLGASPAVKNFNMMNGLPTRLPPPFNMAVGDLPRTSSSSTIASDMFPSASISKRMNWAAKAAAPPPPDTPIPQYKPINREEVIARNRSGQRIDPPSRDYDKAEVDRIKKIKMCNVHFLRDECPFRNNCTHL
ncbi:hypothetical protein N0V90_010684 [Kalmusia sp. IMI 367209]|nr:hypothetical protein N0V90_010684 [Kalmusia sp. IMI 367209]